MENLALASSEFLKNVGKVFMCITWMHNFCINEGCVNMGNVDDYLENEIGYIPYDISETSIAGHSVMRDIIVQKLMQRDLERPTFN